ncbi:MAG: hypothetical protein ACRC2T_00510 [Thermoguttaceae bacterium]
MRKNSAFTIIELLLVLALIIIIGAISFPWLRTSQIKGQLRSTAQQLQSELYNTRLAAMKSGQAYVFRFQGGTGVYEILPKNVWDERTKNFRANIQNLGSQIEQPGMENVRAVGSADQTFGESLYGIQQNTQNNLPQIYSSSSVSASSATGTESFLKELPYKIIFEPVILKPQKSRQTSTPGLETVRSVGSEPSEMLPPSASEQFSSSGNSGSSTQLVWSDPIIFYPNGRTSSATFGVCTTNGMDYRCGINLRGLTGTARIQKPE